jgi:hypothetical protein
VALVEQPVTDRAATRTAAARTRGRNRFMGFS